MHRKILLLVVVLVPLAVAVARDEPLEAFGGYSWVSTGHAPAKSGCQTQIWA